MAKKTTGATIHRLKVTLLDSEPLIWREIEVASEITLDALHVVLQLAMGWTDSHLHQFEKGGVYYSVPDETDYREVQDESETRLSDLLTKRGARMKYEYDFGDGWIHEIAVEQIAPRDAGAFVPRCLAGARACPPEDVGGVWGYANFLDAISNPKHPDHDELLGWIGDGEFDPEAFDVKRVDKQLARAFSAVRRKKPSTRPA
jgi:hypothetical protein